MGDFQIPREAILIVPKSEASKVTRGINKILYGRGETLRQAVERVIEHEGGWKVDMVEQTGNGWPAIMNGVDINQREFFADLLAQNPKLSFGAHTYSEVGEAFRLGVVDLTLQYLFLFFGSGVMSDVRIKFAETIIRHNLAKMSLHTETLTPEMKSAFLSQQKAALEWLNILTVDAQLRTDYGQTLSGTGLKQFETYAALRTTPETLRRYADQMMGQRKLISQSRRQDLEPDVAAEYLGPFTADEARAILDKVAPEWDEGQRHTFWVSYAVRRILELNPNAGGEDELLSLLNDHVAQGRLTPGLAQALFEALIPLLDEDYARLPLIYKILEQGPVQTLMREQLDMAFIGKPSLDAIFRAHPNTKSFYEVDAPAAQTESEQFAMNVLQRLIPTMTSAPPPRRFTEARGNAWSKAWRQQQDRNGVAEINQPLTARRSTNELFPGDTMTFYELMYEGRLGTLDQIVEKLGIKAEFRKAFPKDADFWKSNQSLVECVRALSANTFNPDNENERRRRK